MKEDKEVRSLIAEKEGYSYIIEGEAKDTLIVELADGQRLNLLVDDLISIIVSKFRIKPEAVSLMGVDAKVMPIVDVGRTINIELDKDYSAGEVITRNFSHKMPLQIALAEQLYNKCKINGDTVEMLPIDKMEIYETDIREENIKFVENWYQISEDDSILKEKNNTEKTD